MPGFAYLDASALVKLAVHEPETVALEQVVVNRDALFTSEIGAIEKGPGGGEADCVVI